MVYFYFLLILSMAQGTNAVLSGIVVDQTGASLPGARRLAVNVTADGINVMDQVGNLGVNSVIRLSPDLVDEVRVVTSPADAELGRGSGQVLVSTRAGTNEFHGSLFESHRNTALNANTFFNNQRGDPRDVLIRNQFGGRLGGPIVRNKTFFHFLYDGQREVTKNSTTGLVYTSAARDGVSSAADGPPSTDRRIRQRFENRIRPELEPVSAA